MSIREQIAQNIVSVLKTIEHPAPVLITREPFLVQELAITQFPAILVQIQNEERETISMGVPNVGRRMGTITYQLRGYVRGTELDRRRNDLIESIEEILDGDRYRDLRVEGVIDSQVILIEVVERQPPLAEIVVTFQVRYNYLRAAT
jgi:hypothetical protein